MRTVHRATATEHEVTPRRCTLHAECVVEPGERADWLALSHYHYRSDQIPCVKQIYRVRHVPTGRTVAVRVYAAPSLNSKARNLALEGRYLPGSTIGKKFMAALLNREMELALRTVVHPTFRGCGIGARLVAETLPLRPVKYVEASTAMGNFHPFLSRAGMTRHDIPPNPATLRVLAAIRAFGAHDELICNPSALDAWVRALPAEHFALVEREALRYEKFWIRGRTNREAPITLDRALRRIAANALLTPAYFLWQNPKWSDELGRVVA